ncbi:inner centromere protein A isoform X1 [Etheostoma spectabile]|uniref:inner centromere protein A isoform X1 n=1 Tax=Etheostoma spectabile TaxID=54343 RepID=UPI0013AF1E9B|nr:inner centromere protein isoform X1 [Etheostoma spectabile]XP_032379934.1 inner centromere protein isoform X1 [Etheostoma spectabile]
MNSIRSSVQSLMEMFYDKAQEFTSDINNVHMVWLEEIQQEANRMFSRDFNAEPELMPKTPSQKKSSRRRRVSLAHQEENQARRRFSKGKRSNLRGSSVKSLNFIAEEETIPKASTSEANTDTQLRRTTRKNKQTKSEVAGEVSQSRGSCKTDEVQNKKPELVDEEEVDENDKDNNAEDKPDYILSTKSPPAILLPEVAVSISSSDRLSAEFAQKLQSSPGRTASKIAIAGAAQSSRRSSMRCSLKLRHSLAGLRHSMTQESVRRASRRSMLKRKEARMGNSTCSSKVDEDSCMDSAEEEDRKAMLDAFSADTEDNAAAEELNKTPEIQINQRLLSSVGRITRSVAANCATLADRSLFTTEETVSTPNKKTVAGKYQTPQSGRSSRQSTKRKAPDTVEESPTKRHSPPKKSQSAMRPNMRSFLHTVQKNQMLMMAPNSLGRTAVIKSFIKHTTPLKIDPKLSIGIVSKERHKLEALKKKQEQEEERMKKMEEEKKRKQDELKRKRDERLRRVFEAKVKEEQREEEKKKKIEQKMANIDEKNDKRQADEKAKKKVVIKRQEELEQKRKLEEEAKKKKVQQAEEEKRQQELMAKKKAEEEEQRIRKLAEARRALELKLEREREMEKERERLAAAERERVEKEKALALQRELEIAAREKERRELEEKKVREEKRLEQQQRLAAEEKAAKEREAAAKMAANAQFPVGLNVTVDIEHSVMSTPVGKGGGLNVTVDIEQSPQSYSITPTGSKKPVLSKSTEDYGMDQNSDDSTDDESAPRKTIPSWAEGHNLQQIIMKQYFNPPDLDSFFGTIEPPKLENIFYKSKPRYFKRTSSAVWHSPPVGGK